ncbi:hypothetical protein WJX72_000756 [[Myrmecia] bisecta]|uniref:Dihydrolipoamide acetyltransferase component of pyruvate dehydrogenase complex n=1 Tax=[Myrmecia] bisecta TaxID=41462 RepID=A0AAW1PX53_9CHLO
MLGRCLRRAQQTVLVSLSRQGLSRKPVSCFARVLAAGDGQYAQSWDGTPWGPGGRAWDRAQRSSFSTTASQGSMLVQFPLAQTGEGIKECELIKWFVKEGDKVDVFDPLCEVQSDKAAVEITSRYAGTIMKLHHEPADLVEVGAVLADIQVEGPAAAAPPSAAPELKPGQASSSPAAWRSPPARTVLASPAVRRLAREGGVDLACLAGSGADGRISKEDVLRHLQQQQPSLSQAHTEVPTDAQHGGLPRFEAVPQERVQPRSPLVPLQGYRRAMVKSMTAAGQVPHFHFCDEVNMGALLHVRTCLQGDLALQGAKLTFLPIMLKAMSMALQDFPGINSSLSPDQTHLLHHASHNIGVAMATPTGLVVPNVKAVEEHTIASLAVELGRLQQLAAAGQLSRHDVTGGTLTVSNIGTLGGTYAAPLVNVPEVAIVALGRVQHLPRFGASGDIQRTAIMPISWGADHRVIDGATLAQFSNAWRCLLEQPERMLLRLC